MFNFIGAGCFDMVSSTALVYPYPKRCILRTLISTSSLLLLSLLCVSERGKKSFIIFKVELLNGFFSLSPFLHFLSYFCIWLRRSSCKQWVFKAEASIYNIYFSCFIMCQANLCTDENTFSDIIVRDFFCDFFSDDLFLFFAFLPWWFVVCKIVHMEINIKKYKNSNTQRKREKRTILIVINGLDYMEMGNLMDWNSRCAMFGIK